MEELFRICDEEKSSDNEDGYLSDEGELGNNNDDKKIGDDDDDESSTDRFGNSRRYRYRLIREHKSAVDFREHELSTNSHTFNWYEPGNIS